MASSRIAARPGYGSLAIVLDDALVQAQDGKGKERHTSASAPFTEQPICRIIASEGHGFARGQAIKKIDEAKRLSPQGAIQELLGAIVYLAADVAMIREEMSDGAVGQAVWGRPNGEGA